MALEQFFRDTFSGIASDQALETWVSQETGHSWAKIGTSGAITGSIGPPRSIRSASTSNSLYAAMAAPYWRDYTVRAHVWCKSNNTSIMGAAIRLKNDTSRTGYYLRFANGTGWILSRRRNDSQTNIATDGTTIGTALTAGATYEAEISASGEDPVILRCKVNGTTLFGGPVTDDHADRIKGAGYPGVYGFQHSGTTVGYHIVELSAWEDVSTTPPPEGATIRVGYSGHAGIAIETTEEASGGTGLLTHQWRRDVVGEPGWLDLSGETDGGGLHDDTAQEGTLYRYMLASTDEEDREAESNVVEAQIYTGGAIGGGDVTEADRDAIAAKVVDLMGNTFLRRVVTGGTASIVLPETEAGMPYTADHWITVSGQSRSMGGYNPTTRVLTPDPAFSPAIADGAEYAVDYQPPVSAEIDTTGLATEATQEAIANAVTWTDTNGRGLRHYLQFATVDKGNLSGARTGTETLSGPAGSGVSIVATVDSNGNRTVTPTWPSGT
jgi:hypothetical protein